MIRVPIALSLLWALSAEAAPVKALTTFTEEQIRVLQGAVHGAHASRTTADEAESWTFRRFLLRVVAKAAFDIEAVKLELVPELELVWQKEKPAN